jgi:hypothetical protein
MLPKCKAILLSKQRQIVPEINATNRQTIAKRKRTGKKTYFGYSIPKHKNLFR